MTDLFKGIDNKFDRSIIAYAFLAQTTRGEGDLLSGLAPIFKPIAKIHAGERFDPASFSTIVSDLYGLKVHPWAVEDLIPRLEHAGLISKIQHSKETHEYVYEEITEEFNAVTEGDIRQVIYRFIEFATPILQQNKKPIDKIALEEGFLSQLVNMDFISILLKPDRTKEDMRNNSTLSLKKPKEQTDWEEDVSARSKVDVLCASFIVNTYHEDKDLYDLIMRIATGSILSEVILNLQDPGKTVTLKGLKVALDAPFLMSALDLTSEEGHTFATEICNQLREKGAELVAFEHSVDELKGNLRAVIKNTKEGIGFGSTARRLKSSTFSTYAASVLQNTDTILKQENIKQITAPKSVSYFRYFTEEDQKGFQSCLGFYQNKTALERDAESIAAIVRLRRSKQVKMGRLPTAEYIFVTENTSVVRHAEKFLKRHNMLNDGDVPPAVSKNYLAGLLWVLYGGKGNELTRHLLLANCAAALEPRSDVIAQMHRFLSQVDPRQAELFNTLMTEERAGQYAMQMTLGDSTFINQDNAPAVLEQIKKSLIEKHETEKKAEIYSIKKQHEVEFNKQVEVSKQLHQDLLDASAENMLTSNELTKTNRRVEQIETALGMEKKARVDEKRKLVENCVRSASKYEERLYIIFGLVIATILTVFAWFELLSSQIPWIKNGVSIVTWLITMLFFWKIPDLVLANWLHHIRDSKFRNSLNDLGVEFDSEIFEIDWKSRRVLMKPDKSQSLNQ